MQVALDNDVIFKGLCYGLLLDLVAAIPCAISEVGVLGIARYVVGGLLQRHGIEGVPTIQRLLNLVEILEPSTEEIAFAAQLEILARAANLNLHPGESQLCAIIIGRGGRLATGDKRAILTIARLLEGDPRCPVGRVLCLEQLFLNLLVHRDPAEIRDAVCQHTAIDRALAICFSCAAEDEIPVSPAEGLKSYIADLRREAETILAND